MKKVLAILFIVIFTITITIGCSDLDNSEKLEQNESKSQEQDENNIVEEEIEKHSELSLSATGDIMFHGAQLKSAYNNNTKEYEFNRVFENVKPHLENSDIAIANFETTTAGSEMPVSSYPSFNSPDSTIDALKYAGFDILTTANNHSLDTGKTGILNTIKNIENNGLDYIGTSEEEYRPFILKEKNDITLSFLSYTYGLNGNDSRLNSKELDNMVNLIAEDKMEADIKKAKNVSDKVVVFIHWGNEYSREPSEAQMQLADKIFEWGADIILGSHPHVIQRSEIIKKNGENKFIIYSMGNFISNQRRETLPNTRNNIYTEDGVIVNIDFKKDLETKETIIEDVRYIPTWVYKYPENGKDEYRILPIADFIDSDTLSQGTIERLKNSHKQTMDLMEKVEIVE